MYANYCVSHGDANMGSLLKLCEWYGLRTASLILLCCLSPQCKFCHIECALYIFLGKGVKVDVYHFAMGVSGGEGA